jgi:hypothetical protein
MKRPRTMPGALCSLVVPIMTHAESHGGADCVPVSKAETPVPATVLPSVQSDATDSGGPGFVNGWLDATGRLEPGTLRQRAERRLWELETMAELMATGVGAQTPEGRLLACRWAAARALLLEVLETYEPSPSNWRAIGHPWDGWEERGLLGRLCQRHGWRTVRPGLLSKTGGAGL